MHWYKKSNRSVSIDMSESQSRLESILSEITPYFLRQEELAEAPPDIESYKEKIRSLPAPEGKSSEMDTYLRDKAIKVIDLVGSAIDEHQKEVPLESLDNLVGEIIDSRSGSEWGEIRNLYRILVDLDEHLLAMRNKKPAEQVIIEHRTYLEGELVKAREQAQDLGSKVKAFLDASSYVANASVKSRRGDDIFPADFSVALSFEGDREALIPDFTVFLHEDGSMVIDDVLSWGDSDFFDNQDEMGAYFGLVEFLRTGKMPGQEKGRIKLYRGMSVEEHDKWRSGETIPAGKYFTSSPTAEYAQDISGHFPELFSFLVDRNVVFETSPGEFQTSQDARMEGRKIIPAEKAK